MDNSTSQISKTYVKIDFMGPLLGDDLIGKMYPGDALTLSKTTNFRLFQTQKVCRRQF